MDATRLSCAPQGPFAFMILGALISLFGCSGVVELQNGYLNDPPPNEETPCVDAAIELRNPSRGTFIGDHLHLNAEVDGAERYVVLEVADEAAYVFVQPEALIGSAKLAQLAGDAYARLVVDDSWHLDILDTSSPRAPALVASHPLTGRVPGRWEDVLTANEGLLYFCYEPAPDAMTELAILDLTSPESPGEIVYAPTPLCSGFYDAAFAAAGLWLSWAVGEGVQASQIVSYGLSPDGLTKGIDWGYNPGGIHNYGIIKSAASDGSRVVVDPKNDAWFLVFTATTHPPQGPYTSFPLAGPKRLLTVASQIAYFATPDGVHALDLSDVSAPLLTEYHAEIELDPANTTFLAANPGYLAIADGEGRLYLVPRDRSGKVAPARVYLGQRADGSRGAPGCERP